MRTMMCLLFPLLILGLPSELMAQKKRALLAVDTTDIDYGTVREGQRSFLKHTFTLKNISDTVITIKKIKSECKCTSFKGDSLIFPGKSGHVTAEVDLDKINGGLFSEYVIVYTDADNYPRIRFSLNGTLASFISVDLQSIVLPTMQKKDTVQAITLGTGKNDLQVLSVAFETDNQTSAWLSNLPIRFAFKKSDKKPEGPTVFYTLTVFYFPVEKESHYGNFIITTNHPQKKVLKISGVLDPRK